MENVIVDERLTDRFENEYRNTGKTLTTPAVRRLAAEHKINLNDVAGTGKEGRVLKEDVLNFINQSVQTETKSDAETEKFSPKSPSQTTFQPLKSTIEAKAPLPKDRTEPIKGITKSMFNSMTNAISVPHFGLSEEIDLTHLVRLRPDIKRISKERNVQISYMPFFIKAASLALNNYPILNSSIDKSDNIIYKSSHNIGVAMDTKQGLIVPNIKRVNQLTIVEIAQELNRLQELGKKGQLGTSDLSGGTFTLSNIGSVCVLTLKFVGLLLIDSFQIGGIFGIPLLMPNEVVIGAIGRMRQVPRFVNDTTDQIERAHVMQVLWSADHRIIDGATMTRFCNQWKKYLENPLEMFL